MLGALFLTAYLGGAVATHARIESPLLTHTLFPVYVAILAWATPYSGVTPPTAMPPLSVASAAPPLAREVW